MHSDADYEKLRKALEEAEDRFESCDNCERPSREEDLKVVWCKEAESGEQVDARICLACRLEAQRDQALQALAEYREGLRKNLLAFAQEEKGNAEASMAIPASPDRNLGRAEAFEVLARRAERLYSALQAIPIPEQPKSKCGRCGGYGKARAHKGEPQSPNYVCPDCHGTGKKPGEGEDRG
jgi:predicted RNA-binding Zn-ribbon protein involved in translation (DUF1610 family)